MWKWNLEVVDDDVSVMLLWQFLSRFVLSQHALSCWGTHLEQGVQVQWGGYCLVMLVSIGIHMNVRISVFKAEHCTAARWPKVCISIFNRVNGVLSNERGSPGHRGDLNSPESPFQITD